MTSYDRVLKAREWLSFCNVMTSNFEEYVRREIYFIESLDFYMMDMNESILFRYDSIGSIAINGGESSYLWSVVQILFSIISRNTLYIIDPNYEESLVYKRYQDFIDTNQTAMFCHDKNFVPQQVTIFHYNDGIIIDGDNSILLRSIEPSLSRVLQLKTKGLEYLQQKYNINYLGDEFDFLPSNQRDQFVQSRLQYLLKMISQQTNSYHSQYLSRTSFGTFDLNDIPIINGTKLSSLVPPYGSGIMSSDLHYGYSFGSGGTTGNMKFVYREFWEDDDNARYIAKGLYASGLRKTDIVINCLSGGFWGGLHVFSLALRIIGCAIVPLGSNFTKEEVVTFIRKLKPTALLAIPSYLVSIVEYIESCQNAIADIVPSRDGDIGDGMSNVCIGTASVSEPSVCVNKIITGGEILHDTVIDKFKKVFHAQQILSTGFTSNETGAIAFQCQHMQGTRRYHMHENMQHVSVESFVDNFSEEGSQSCSKRGADAVGEVHKKRTGKFVMTNLNRLVMPVIRYEIGDYGEMYSECDDAQACPCGRKLRVLQLFGRCDDRIRVGGEDVDMHALSQILGRYAEFVSLTFSVVVDKSASTLRDILIINVEKSVLYEQSSDKSKIHHNYIQSTTPEWNDEEEFKTRLLCDLFVNTHLNWELTFYQQQVIAQMHMINQCAKSQTGVYIECPEVIIFPTGKIPRNLRTGKVTLITDKRIK